MRTQPGNYIRLTSTTSFSLWTQNRTWILELTWDERGMSHTFISHKLYLNDINITSTGIHLDFAPFLIIHRASWSSNESKVSLTSDCEEKFLKEESSNSIFCRKSLIISQNTSHPFLFKLAGTHIILLPLVGGQIEHSIYHPWWIRNLETLKVPDKSPSFLENGVEMGKSISSTINFSIGNPNRVEILVE